MTARDESTDESPGQSERERVPAERRGVLVGVVLPFSLVLVAVVGVIAAVLSLRSPAQVAVLSDSMLTVLVLCPLVICLFPLVILGLALVSSVSRWHAKTRSPLRRLEAWTAALEQNVEGWLGNVDERVLDWAVRLAPFRELLTTFDAPAAEPKDEGIE